MKIIKLYIKKCKSEKNEILISLLLKNINLIIQNKYKLDFYTINKTQLKNKKIFSNYIFPIMILDKKKIDGLKNIRNFIENLKNPINSDIYNSNTNTNPYNKFIVEDLDNNTNFNKNNINDNENKNNINENENDLLKKHKKNIDLRNLKENSSITPNNKKNFNNNSSVMDMLENFMDNRKTTNLP